MTPLLIAAACSSSSRTDDADIAGAEGEQLGQDRADQTAQELVGVSDATVIAESGAIMLALDQGEIAEAQFAIDNAVDPAVIAFANDMKAAHSDHMDATINLLDSFNVDPQDNPIAAGLDAEVSDALAQLQRSTDIDFDYTRMQVSMHAEAFIIVTELARLQPNNIASSFFTSTSVMIDDHRARAEALLRQL